MNKRILSSVLACVLLTGCGNVAASQITAAEVTSTPQTVVELESVEESREALSSAEEQPAVSFVDALGREVTVTSHDRVAALIGSFADIWLTAGGELVAAANDSWESLGLPLDENVVNLGSILEPNVEQLIAAQPDLVLASANTDADVELLDTLEAAGLNVAYFNVSGFDDYLGMLEICTQITGREDLYEANGTAVAEQIAQIKTRVDDSHPTVLFLRASAKSVKVKNSQDSVTGEMLYDLGCVNIADSDDGLLEDLSMEKILVADPDYIFVTIQGTGIEQAQENIRQELEENPVWSNLTAVQNENYYLLDKRLFNLKPNARWAEAYEILADILYPEA